MDNILFSPYKLNSQITLKNRIIMAPLTRCFADDSLCATKSMANYYEKRSDAGLIISEATIINKEAQGYPNVPGIFTEEQMLSWKQVTKQVHSKDGKIFMQLWHVGRVAHSFYLKGKPPVAPSAVALSGPLSRSKNLFYEMPKCLSILEIEVIIDEYRLAAKRAMEAGFDGVEIHGANGYLIDQFLHQESNQREDQFGIDSSGRIKFAVDVVNAITQEIGEHKTAIRLSPGAYFNMSHTKGDEETFKLLLTYLNKLELAYVHTGIFNDTTIFDYLGGTATSFLKKNYSGTVVGCGSYTFETGLQSIEEDKFDLLAIGRAFIANPNLISLLKNNEKLIPYNEAMLKTLI